MAMLAEPRRRQKWGLNPRGTLWADDQNKFGQKLMEKMGWNKGEGLGKEGQGITEHIKVNHKDNTKGVGYKGKDDEWVKHVDAFENVLAALNSENNSADNSVNNSPNNSVSNSPANSEDEDEEIKSRKSLEKRSKDSRARVHYHKFTRGKDLSNYKEDDLACILGSKKSKRKDSVDIEVPKEEPIAKDVFGDEIGTTKKEHGVVTIAGGNYQEYFAKKMAALKKQREGNENNVKDEVREESALNTSEEDSLETKKSKKKKKRDKDHLAPSINDSNISQSEENYNTNENVEKKRKKKKRKTDDSNSNVLVEENNKEDDRPLFGFEFSCGFTNGTTIKKYPLNKHNIFSNDDNTETNKDYENIKKTISPDEQKRQICSESNKKKKHNKELESFSETIEVKEKKKKKKSKDVCNEIENTNGISKNENSVNEFEEVRKKKKKRCKNKNAEKISIVFENENVAEFKPKEKVKKKESTKETVLIDCEPVNSELKKKKKKNKIKMEENNLIVEEISSTRNDNENSNLKEKRKGKKRKREEEEDCDNDSSKSKKIKTITDESSQNVSPGKHKLKRKEYWKKRSGEMARNKKARRIKENAKKSKPWNTSKKEKQRDLANKLITAFEGAKVPNILTKREKKKMEQSRVP